jgi:hypothetical protein
MGQGLEQFREAFSHGPRTPIRRPSQQVQIPATTEWQVVKTLFMNPYRLHSLQAFRNKYKQIAHIYL